MFSDVTKERFWSKVDKSAGPDGCWPWIAGQSRKGYGFFWEGAPVRKMTYGHRISYRMAYGDIADGMMVDHICRNRSCVNPRHLRQVDARTNTVENSKSVSALNMAKTHCHSGHEYNAENTKIYNHKNGHKHRLCKICLKAKSIVDVARKAYLRDIARQALTPTPQEQAHGND